MTELHQLGKWNMNFMTREVCWHWGIFISAMNECIFKAMSVFKTELTIFLSTFLLHVWRQRCSEIKTSRANSGSEREEPESWEQRPCREVTTWKPGINLFDGSHETNYKMLQNHLDCSVILTGRLHSQNNTT